MKINEVLKEIDYLINHFESLDLQNLKERLNRFLKEFEDNNIFEAYFPLLNLLENFSKEKVLEVLKEIKILITKFFLKEDNFLLITENKEDFYDLIKVLTLEGFKVAIEGYSGDIIDYVYSKRPEALLIDNDSKNHGFFIMKIIDDEEIAKKMPVIVLGSSKDDKIKALSLGAIDYIQKPFDLDEVVLKLKNIYRLSNIYIKNNIYDIFTGVYSRFYGDLIVKKEFLKAKNDGIKLIYMLLDFDGMANINLKLGKSKGNDVLKESAALFRNIIPESDVIYRLNGDEFAILFFNKSIIEVLALAEKMQKELENLSKKYGISLSFSAGVAEFDNNMKSVEDLVKLADLSLKKAKAEGGRKIYTSKQVLKDAKKKILIVDDDKIILSILSKRYSNKGYMVFTASNAEEGVEVFKENTDIDLIISDFYMPGMTGDEFTKEVKSLNKKVKIIVLSAHKSEEHVKKALNAGADDYITKPFSPVELDIRIKKLIG
ncbi:diguanylate cyclase (GGDEF) domain-containing protein [Caloramator fervidus]|uniref:Stage 0 sporulation protein A homolog n=1 Tax=Caloramator fervidus TaxID=29344 RepID=A0A1H5RJU5_9CLOT|nr:response regulator [Caloramator fervidus]SEF38626.1 diguanylate cyclase (GGDEF) domain-containing protein [Caloramator fervidus]